MDEQLQSVLMVSGEMIADRDREIESLRTSLSRMKLERDEALQDVQRMKRIFGKQ